MPVLVVGAGPVGLTAALDLAQRGVQVVLIDDNDQVAIGSRAVCWAQRTLEIWDRLGIGEEIAARGVRWQVGRVFHGESLAYHFDLAEEGGSKMPPFVNLQQNLVEQMLVEACMKEPLIELRWKHRLVGLHQAGDHVRAEIEAPEGKVMLEADWLLACDGAKSDTRKLLGLTFEGQVFPDRFLIADVRMQGDFPAERWFWFDPPFHPGQSVLLHKQAEDLWRIDFQLGRDADAELEKRPERVLPRIRAMLGPEARFELDWVSVYQFACRRLEKFRHGRVFFVGDSAHQVSPFGARGANSGVQDADNLGWKLAAVLQGTAPESLLDSYHAERAAAADENILHSTRATDFISPKSAAARRLRDAVLALARSEAFARPLVNSGRLSRPTPYVLPDNDTGFDAGLAPGQACVDAPCGEVWLLDQLGTGFSVLSFGPLANAAACGLPVITADASDALLRQRYDGRPGSCYLIRPDAHVAARWRHGDGREVAAAHLKALSC